MSEINFKYSLDWKSQAFLIILLAAMNQFTTALASNVVVVVLPSISQDLGITVSMLNWISLIFMMSLIAVSIPLSKVINQRGVKKYTKFAMWGLIAGLIISAVSTHMEFFLLSRIVQGVTIAILYVSVYMMVVLGLPEESTGRALGIVGSTGYIGMTLAPTIGGIISNYLSWRFAFIIIVPVLLVQLVIAHYITDEWVGDKKPIDKAGSLMYGVMIILVIYGLSTVTNNGLVFLAAFAVILAIYILYEKRKEFRVYNLSLFRHRDYVVGNYAGFVSYFATFMATYVISFHLQVVMGMDSQSAGMLLFISPIIMIFVAPYAGKQSDKHDSRVLSAIAMAVIIATLVILVFLNQIPFYMIIAALVLQGIGHGLFSSPNNRFVLTSVDVDDLPDASAFLSSSKEMGKLIGLSLFNVICVIFIGQVEISSNVGGLIYSNRLIMIIASLFAVSALLALVISKLTHEHIESRDVIDLFKRLFTERIRRIALVVREE